MIAQYNGYCRECGDGIAKGDEAHYAESVLTCLDCGPATPDARRGAAAGFEDAPGYVRVLAKRVEAAEAKAESLEGMVNRQAADLIRLQEWAAKLSAELGVDAPEDDE